jgi:diguanylate cyclase (GGDEF)-like protein/PAS domain S-box-containing protein
MSIKFKLALPTVLVLIILVVIYQFYRLPAQIARAKNEYILQTNNILKASHPSIVSNLLKRDYGALFSGMERLETANAGAWINLVLHNESGKRIYPLFSDPEDSTPNDDILVIKQDLELSGSYLGRIELTVNWQKYKNKAISIIEATRNETALILFASLLIALIIQYHSIYYPLQQLAKATKKIRRGNYDVSLPSHNNDEMGLLIQSFEKMKHELAFRQQALSEHAIVSETDRTGVITRVNDKFLEVSGYTKNELLGRKHSILKSGIHDNAFYESLWSTISAGQVWQGEICNRKKTGEEYWVSSTIVPFINEIGKVERFISIRTDITERKLVEEEMRYLANHDQLTGLPTRRLGKECLNIAIADAKREKYKVAVCFLDLDGFKMVNDSMGHEVGDNLLIQVSTRLTDLLRETDTVIRMGGDEFVVILSKVKRQNDIAYVANKIIDQITNPFELAENDVRVGVSIGISLYPDNSLDAEDLISQADEVMYRVKRNGKNNYLFYE